MIRVLIVDDSLAARSAVARALGREVDLEVLRPAASGEVALQRVDQESPDVVVLDVEMPGLDGLEVLDEIRLRQPDLPVIMFSCATEDGATVTLDALAKGAADALAKPTGDDDFADVMAMLAAKIRVLGAAAASRRGARKVLRPRARREVGNIVDAVVIGISTGGPNALADLLPRFAADFPVPIVVVQHMPPVFTRQFAERMDARSALRVREAEDGELLEAGSVWIAPGGRHLGLQRCEQGVRTKLHDGPPENSCRPAVDVLFRDAAACYGSRLLAVMMTGMGQDGLLGSQEVVSTGGSVIAQDEATSVVWGMPGAVVRQGIASKVLPLDMLAGEIDRRVRSCRTPVTDTP